MNAYQEARAAERTHLLERLEAIAAELEGWQLEAPEDRNPYLVNGDGVRIWTHLVQYGAGAGRLELSTGIPDGAVYSQGDWTRTDAPRVEITVSLERPAATLARDIVRRVVPGAVAFWQEVSGRVARRLERENNRATLAAELAEIMHGQTFERAGDIRAELPDALRNGGTYCYGHLAPGYDGTVTLEVHNLTAERARDLARTFAAWSEADR